MCAKNIDKRSIGNLIIIIITYLLNTFLLRQYFFRDADPFWKGLYYLLNGLILLWFLIDIYRGWNNTYQFEICMVYMISVAGMLILNGLSVLYIVKSHPMFYIVLFNGITWNTILFELLRKLTYKLF